MTEVAGEYAGLKPKQARTKIIEDLEARGFVEKIEDIVHRTPISERSKAPIEIIPMEEYYVKQKEKVEKMKKIGEESGQEFAKLITSLDKFGQAVSTGQITVESFTKETAIQDRIMKKLMNTLLSAGPPTSDFAFKVQELMKAFKDSRAAILAFALTLDFLNKSFDIKGLGKFREFIDGSGKIATTARELKEAKFKQLKIYHPDLV